MNRVLKIFFVLCALAMTSTSLAQRARDKTERPLSREVEAFKKSLSKLGLGENVDGLKALAEQRPELNERLKDITKKLAEEKLQKNIRDNKAKFQELSDKIDASAAEAAEVRASRMQLSGSAENLLSAIEALPGVLAELAAAGPKGDIQKAIDVADILSKLSTKDLSNEADASAKVRVLEERLGKDKNGNPISIEEFIKRCLGK
ncbi:MAG: hypothetical protein H6623_02560 [Bdellovibrionaceae bacterium]|nr:hypothetical protein [Pseudobdellovibrionaceae bacterium]